MSGRRGGSPATAILIALILVAFALQLIGGDEVTDRFANRPQLVRDGQYYRLLTAMFLHAGGVHLVVNLIALYQLGRYYELMFGSRRFVFIYFVSGLAASLASTWWNKYPSVGASGAILGILGAFIFSVRRSPRWRSSPAGRSLVTQGVFWILANLIITMTIPYIDKAGHFGGLLSGLILGAILPPPPEPPLPPAEVVIDVRPYEGPDEDPAARTDDRSWRG